MQRLLGQSEQNSREDPQGAVAVGALVVAGRQTADLLAAVDQPLHAVPQPVHGAVERPAPALPPLARDGVADAAASTVPAVGASRVAFVAYHALGPEPRAPAAEPLHRPLLPQPGKDGRFVLLAQGQQEGQELAPTFRAEVHLRREAALAAPER